MKLILVMALTVFLGGCASQLLTSTEPQQTIYSLRPVEPTGEQSTQTAKVVEILTPTVPPGMDRDRIALFLDNGQKIDYYAGVNWPATLEKTLQEFTRRSASAVLPYVVAVTPDESVNADYSLQVKVNEFQPVYATDFSAPPVLKVNIEFTLVRLPLDRIVTSFTLSRQEVAAENRLDVITLGLESLLRDIHREAFLKMDAKLKVQ